MPNVKSIDIKLSLWRRVEVSCFSTTTDEINTTKPRRAACDPPLSRLTTEIYIQEKYTNSPMHSAKVPCRLHVIESQTLEIRRCKPVCPSCGLGTANHMQLSQTDQITDTKKSTLLTYLLSWRILLFTSPLSEELHHFDFTLSRDLEVTYLLTHRSDSIILLYKKLIFSVYYYVVIK